MSSIPHGATARVIDADGNVGRADIVQFNDHYLIYAQSQWLKEAALPITYELIIPQDESFCCIA